jgi:hypothetical protein
MMRGYGTLLKKFVVGGSVLAVAACSDTTAVTVPQQEAQIIQGSGPAELSQTGTDTLKVSLWVDPRYTKSYYLGAGNTLSIPAWSVCDISSSSYGTTEWDKPCTAETQAFTLKIKGWLDQNGNIRVDFEPAMRFVPSAIATKWVMLQMTDSRFAYDPRYKIFYCPSITSSVCIDEAKTDLSLATIKVGSVFKRRIKHFSGYNVAAREMADEMMMMSRTGESPSLDGGRDKQLRLTPGRDTTIRGR